MGKSGGFSLCLETQVSVPNCSLIALFAVLSGNCLWERCAKLEMVYWHFKEGRRNSNRKGRSAFRGLETGRLTVFGGNLLCSVGTYCFRWKLTVFCGNLLCSWEPTVFGGNLLSSWELTVFGGNLLSSMESYSVRWKLLSSWELTVFGGNLLCSIGTYCVRRNLLCSVETY